MVPRAASPAEFRKLTNGSSCDFVCKAMLGKLGATEFSVSRWLAVYKVAARYQKENISGDYVFWGGTTQCG